MKKVHANEIIVVYAKASHLGDESRKGKFRIKVQKMMSNDDCTLIILSNGIRDSICFSVISS